MKEVVWFEQFWPIIRHTLSTPWGLIHYRNHAIITLGSLMQRLCSQMHHYDAISPYEWNRKWYDNGRAMTAKRREGDISRPRSPTCLNSAVHQPNHMNVPFVQILYESHCTFGRKWYLFTKYIQYKTGLWRLHISFIKILKIYDFINRPNINSCWQIHFVHYHR